MVEARGWAVCQDDALLVETVSPTERAAMVNWLVVKAGIMVGNSLTDLWIANRFALASARLGAELVQVRITTDDAN